MSTFQMKSAKPPIKSKSSKGQSGFTLIELMVVLIVGVILLTIGIPSLSEFVTSQRVTRNANQLLADLALARTQALVLQRPVRVSAVGGDWTSGWIVASDADSNEAIDGVGLAADEQFREQEPLPEDFSLYFADAGGTDLTSVWFDRLGAGTQLLPANVKVTYPARFYLERPDGDASRGSTLCLAASGVAIIRKGKVAC